MVILTKRLCAGNQRWKSLLKPSGQICELLAPAIFSFVNVAENSKFLRLIAVFLVRPERQARSDLTSQTHYCRKYFLIGRFIRLRFEMHIYSDIGTRFLCRQKKWLYWPSEAIWKNHAPILIYFNYDNFY